MEKLLILSEERELHSGAELRLGLGLMGWNCAVNVNTTHTRERTCSIHN